MNTKVVFFGLAVVVATLAAAELIFRLWIFQKNSSIESAYQSIVYDKSVVGYISQPYLNYINNPKLLDKEGNAEINSMGIRYPREVALDKPAGTYRILFLGGSTTFGDVDDAFDVFPALIEKRLKDSVSLLNPAFQAVECLNAGVHGLTSAELLTHFQFKYQYLQPDLVVLHTGFNDAFMYAGINDAPYQPDYHNSRRVFRDVPELTRWQRWLMRSKMIAYFIISIRLSDYLKTTLEDNIFFRHTHHHLWFKPGNAAISDSAYNAFYNNITTLSLAAKKRGADILLVPEVCDSTKMPPPLNTLMPRGLRLNKRFMERMAVANGLHYCPLPEAEFTPDMFLDEDGIHVNEQGERLKALHIGTCVSEILRQRGKNN